MKNKIKIFLLAFIAVMFLMASYADVYAQSNVNLQKQKMKKRSATSVSTNVKDALIYSASDTVYTEVTSLDCDSLQLFIDYNDSIKVAVWGMTAVSGSGTFYRTTAALDTLTSTATAGGYKGYNYSQILSKIGQPFGAVKFELIFQSSGNGTSSDRSFSTYVKKYLRK